MKKLFLIPVLAMALVSCGNNKTAEGSSEENNEATDEVEAIALPQNSQWRLVDYPGESEICVMDSTENYVLTFQKDGNFGMSTDCNSLGGQYVVNGDSLKFENIAMTQMACPNEKVEKDMSTILPMIDTYLVTPDSTLILRSDARIMATFKSVNE